MGATGSKPDQEVVDGGADATFFAHRDSPVQFSESLINHLSSQSLPTSAVPSSRQDALDSHIQARIATELSKLRQQEAQVRDEIERALEKENLDREMGAASAQEGGKALSHSTSLIKDLEELEKRTASLKKQREETDEWRRVDDGKNELEKCFACVAPLSLGCAPRRQG
ncbi:SPOSA6832_03640, partial [Sporobolomyces salmonicolor]